MRFSVGKTAAHKRPGTRSVSRIERVNIEGYSIATTRPRRDFNCFVHTRAHSSFVNLPHGDETDSELLNEFTLARIHVAGTDMRTESRVELWSKTSQVYQFRCAISEDYRQWHSVNISRRRSLRYVHISVRIKPDQPRSFILLPAVCREARNRTNGD